jgi:hypothetical protein
MSRRLARKPQSAHEVLYSQSVGMKLPKPPSWQRVSPGGSASQVFAHSLKGACELQRTLRSRRSVG